MGLISLWQSAKARAAAAWLRGEGVIADPPNHLTSKALTGSEACETGDQHLMRRVKLRPIRHDRTSGSQGSSLARRFSDQNRSGEFATSAVAALLPSDLELRIAIYHVKDKQWSLDDIQSRNEELARQQRREFDNLYIEVSGSTAYSSTMLAIASRSRKLTRSIGDSSQGEIDFGENAPSVIRKRLEPNPAFLYENARYTEVWIGKPHIQTPELQDFVLMGEVIRLLAAAATAVPAPILFLESPSSRPDASAAGSNRDKLRRSSDFGVRCAVTISGQTLQRRDSYWMSIIDIACDFGMEAWIGDRRQAKGRGLWYRLVEEVDSVYREQRSQVKLGTVDRTVASCLPFTSVGPSRVGTTYWHLNHITRALGAVILSASISTLADHAIIHFTLAARRGFVLDGAREKLEAIVDGGAGGLVRSAPFKPYHELHSVENGRGRRSDELQRLIEALDGKGVSDQASPIGFSPCVGPTHGEIQLEFDRTRIALWGG